MRRSQDPEQCPDNVRVDTSSVARHCRTLSGHCTHLGPAYSLGRRHSSITKITCSMLLSLTSGVRVCVRAFLSTLKQHGVQDIMKIKKTLQRI